MRRRGRSDMAHGVFDQHKNVLWLTSVSIFHPCYSGCSAPWSSRVLRASACADADGRTFLFENEKKAWLHMLEWFLGAIGVPWLANFVVWRPVILCIADADGRTCFWFFL